MNLQDFLHFQHDSNYYLVSYDDGRSNPFYMALYWFELGETCSMGGDNFSIIRTMESSFSKLNQNMVKYLKAHHETGDVRLEKYFEVAPDKELDYTDELQNGLIDLYSAGIKFSQSNKVIYCNLRDLLQQEVKDLVDNYGFHVKLKIKEYEINH